MAFVAPTQLHHALLNTLSRGPVAAGRLVELLQISRATLSRRMATLQQQVLTMGRGPSTTYGLRRAIPELRENSARGIPVHRIEPSGLATRIGTLTSVQSSATYFWFQDELNPAQSRGFDDLPWFIVDMRPQGFMGRAFCHQNRVELRLPDRLNDWNADQILLALTTRGDDAIGNLVVGEEALNRWASAMQRPGASLERENRHAVFGQYANAAIAGHPAGSSAAGEQPKFGLCVANAKGEPIQVLVKFSPSLNTNTGRRWGDLLIAESVAATVLREFGFQTAESEIVTDRERIYLQVERFDRTGRAGRVGVVSLSSVDSEYVGNGASWSAAVAGLVEQNRLDGGDLMSVQTLEAFGRLIANNDRHLGNLSLYFDGNYRFRLAPVYDMLPMDYAPVANENPVREFNPLPMGNALIAWSRALPIATRFWEQLQLQPLLSEEFRQIAAMNAEVIGRMTPLAAIN